MKNRRGQAAIEYMTVFGIALLLSTPFIMRAQSSIMDLKTGSEIIEMRDSLSKIETSVQTVGAAGEPARRTFHVEIPRSVVSSRIENDTVVFTLRGPAGNSDMSRSFETNVTGTLPDTPGIHRLTVYAENGAVYIEVVG